MTSFAIVGSGWRAEYFWRLAAAVDGLSCVGVVSRAQKDLPVPVYLSLDECLVAARPDFVVTATPWEVTPTLVVELVERGVRVLAETPPAPDVEGLRELWRKVGDRESVADLKTDVAANIRGGAAVLRALADEQGMTDRDRLDAWYPVVAEFGGAAVPQTRQLYADAVYDVLRTGVSAVAPTGEHITVDARPVAPARGTLGAALAPDYPGAIWNPASSANYATGRTASISMVVIHVTQGSYAGTISWFQNPDSQVSAHYVARSSDGEVTQMVADADTAWHARSANPSALGIEHEGFVDDPAWFTDQMYRSSAALTKWLCDTYGLAKTRDVIVGHSEVPGNDHTDPGPNWDWDYYLGLVTA